MLTMTALADASLENWVPSRRLTLEGARAHSRRVRTLRTVLLTLSVACVGSLVGSLMASALDGAGGGRRQLSGQEIVTMLNPRFTGRDTFGRAFVLTADTAQRQRGNADLVELVNPRLVDEASRIVTAPRGLFDQSTQTLELFEDVRAEEADGHVFRSAQAKFYVTDGRVEGSSPLEGTGPLGTIRADSYEIMEDGASIRLKGRVRSVFQGSKPRAASPDTPTETDNPAPPDTAPNETSGDTP
jgi:lipopolysaccharide export system protein LptC